MSNQCDNVAAKAPVAFVTGATGLLGNNLVRELLAAGWQVRALARSPEKARRQLDGIEVEIVTGDVRNVSAFAGALRGVEVVFHTAAYFRDAYKGGRHWRDLYATNVEGTRDLLECAYRSGVRRFVHTSSVAVLYGKPGEIINESMLRDEKDADDYYRSKILADHVVLDFLSRHADFWAAMVLPGYMHGPGDFGPTAAAQTMIDVAQGRLPGIPPGSVSVVDARDVAQAMILANQKGRRGERYLAAGQHMTMAELLPLIGQAMHVKAPERQIPLWLLYILALGNEGVARLTGRPVLLSWDMVKNIAHENDRSHYSQAKSKEELGLCFRPVKDTLQDTANWLYANGMCGVSRPEAS